MCFKRLQEKSSTSPDINMAAGFRAIQNSDGTPVDPLEISIEIANIVIAGADTTVYFLALLLQGREAADLRRRQFLSVQSSTMSPPTIVFTPNCAMRLTPPPKPANCLRSSPSKRHRLIFPTCNSLSKRHFGYIPPVCTLFEFNVLALRQRYQSDINSLRLS